MEVTESLDDIVELAARVPRFLNFTLNMSSGIRCWAKALGPPSSDLGSMSAVGIFLGEVLTTIPLCLPGFPFEELLLIIVVIPEK